MNHDIDRTQVRYANGASCHDHGSPAFDELEHSGLATDLLDVDSEEELAAFLDEAVSAAAHGAGGFINPPVRHALLRQLKELAKRYLPMAAEGLGESGNHDPEELEWQAAHNVVKLAGEAAQNAAHMHPSGNADEDAHAALTEAIQVHAPHLAGFLPPRQAKSHECHCQREGKPGHEHHAEGQRGSKDSGRWYRDGKQIVLVGI